MGMEQRRTTFNVVHTRPALGHKETLRQVNAMSTLPPKADICGAPMSALGQKQTCALHQPMSALPPIATAKAKFRKRSCPLSTRKRTFALQNSYTLFNANLRCLFRAIRARDVAHPPLPCAHHWTCGRLRIRAADVPYQPVRDSRAVP